MLIPLQTDFDDFLLSYACTLKNSYLSFSLNSICPLKCFYIDFQCLYSVIPWAMILCTCSLMMCVSSNPTARVEIVITFLLLNSILITEIKPGVNVQTTC